jgi:hypothetical protein
MRVFPLLQAMGTDQILFDTIHDLIANPSERQQQDHVVAFVERVYFQRRIEEKVEEKKKGFSIFLG